MESTDTTNKNGIQHQSQPPSKGTCASTSDGASAIPPPNFPALKIGRRESSIEEIKSQWLRYNHQHAPQKDVIAMVSDARKSLWKSICGCVKGVKTVKDWKANGVCSAHIFVSKSTIKSIELKHTCTDEHTGRKRNYNSRQLHMASEELMKTLPSTTKRARRSDAAQDYIEAAQKEGFAVGKTQAYKVVFRMSRQPIEAQIGEFYFLTSLFKAWKRADPDGSYTLDTNLCAWKQQTRVQQFQRYYIAPSTSKYAWKYSKVHMFVSDASETSSNWSSFQMSLLLAVTLDGNNDVVVLAMALCDSDSELNWIWFLQNLMRDFNKIHVFLSSSEHVTDGIHIPNLLDLMNAAPSRCVDNIVASLEKSLNLELTHDEKEQIHQLARSTSSQGYKSQIRGLSNTNPDVAVYLDERKEKFVSYCLLQERSQEPETIKRQRFGAVVSNANSLVHSNIQELKDQPVSSMSTSLLMKISETNLQRKQQAQKWLDDGQLLSNHAKEMYDKIMEESETCQVQILSQHANIWRAIVSQSPKAANYNTEPSALSSFMVMVNTGSFNVECSCQYTQEMGLPCVHGTALLRSQNLILGADARWFHPRYHVATLIQMYDYEPPDFSVFGKVVVEELIPPEHSVRGIPKRRKTQTGTPSNPHKCAACGELGHHPKTCHRPSTKYRYGQFADRAMEWAKGALDLQTS